MARRFVSEFLLPLVKGGALHVGRPLGPRSVERLGAVLAAAPAGFAVGEIKASLGGELPPEEAEALVELGRYRRRRIVDLLPASAAPPLDMVTLRLGAAAHNLLSLGHPEISGRGLEARQERIAAAAVLLAGAGPPRSVADAVSRHSLLARLPEIVRSDRTVHFWVGRRNFVGRVPPRRITALPRLRSVRVDLVRRAWLREIGIPAVGRTAFLALNLASPLGEALDPMRLEPPLAWSRILAVLRFPALCRAVVSRALDIGVGRAGEALADALFRFASLQEPPGGLPATAEALRFAIRFLAHLVWLDLLFVGAPGGGTAAAGASAGLRSAAEAPGDFGFELAVILVAAARTATRLVWPADLPRDGDLGRAFAARLEAMAARVGAQNPPRLNAALGIAALAVGLDSPGEKGEEGRSF
jgi:hypothetical protein